jgi:hypothetical protein
MKPEPALIGITAALFGLAAGYALGYTEGFSDCANSNLSDTSIIRPLWHGHQSPKPPRTLERLDRPCMPMLRHGLGASGRTL